MHYLMSELTRNANTFLDTDTQNRFRRVAGHFAPPDLSVPSDSNLCCKHTADLVSLDDCYLCPDTPVTIPWNNGNQVCCKKDKQKKGVISLCQAKFSAQTISV